MDLAGAIVEAQVLVTGLLEALFLPRLIPFEAAEHEAGGKAHTADDGDDYGTDCGRQKFIGFLLELILSTSDLLVVFLELIGELRTFVE